MSSEKKKWEKGRRQRGVLAGVLLSAAVLLLGVLLIEKGIIPPESFSLTATVCIALGAALAGKMGQSGKALCGIKSGAEYAAVIIIILLALCFEEICWERIAVIIAASLVFAVLGNLTNLCISNKKFHKTSLKRH